ncbi:unnamed protein product [Durusdinium trenchii]|uniref:Uncharacterized protein n=1 Tax=Durusdinium trenchii TaxID=1381693 RepID=A0ABP0PK11_9DINO
MALGRRGHHAWRPPRRCCFLRGIVLHIPERLRSWDGRTRLNRLELFLSVLLPSGSESDDVSMSPCHGTEHPTQWSQQLAAACVLVCVFFWGDGGWQRPNQRWSVQENKVSRPTPQILILLG